MTLRSTRLREWRTLVKVYCTVQPLRTVPSSSSVMRHVRQRKLEISVSQSPNAYQLFSNRYTILLTAIPVDPGGIGISVHNLHKQVNACLVLTLRHSSSDTETAFWASLLVLAFMLESASFSRLLVCLLIASCLQRHRRALALWLSSVSADRGKRPGGTPEDSFLH